MEECKSFYDLAEKVESFEPDYTDEFIEYMEESIRQSIINEARAIESASKIIIF